MRAPVRYRQGGPHIGRRHHVPRIVIYEDGRMEMRTRLKEIDRCPSCRKRKFLELVVDADGMEWHEEVHTSEFASGLCEAKMFPPWLDDKWESPWKRNWREIRWRWLTEWKPRLQRLRSKF